MAIAINKLTNANVYVNGNSLLGRASEIETPNPEFIMAEHEALGMVGKTEFFAGIDKMEATIKWNSFYADVYRRTANPLRSIQMQVRGNLQTFTSSGGLQQEVAAVVYMTATPKNLPTGNFKQHENVELETMFNVTYLKVEIAGEVQTEIDILANVFKVNGVDILATYRANIGG
jgi:uncharacterized protein